MDDLGLKPEKLRDGFVARPATEQDVPAVTELIHSAFDVWKRSGLKLSPMFQTENQTRSHLIPNGFVIESDERQLVGTFSLDRGYIREYSDSLEFTEGSSPAVHFSKLSACEPGSYLIFKKAAVLEAFSGKGLGAQMLDLAEKHLGAEIGLAIETVAEARWLYDWYKRAGFKTVGKYQYPNSEVATLLMVKRLR